MADPVASDAPFHLVGAAPAPSYIRAMNGPELILYHDFASPYCRLALALTRPAAHHAGLGLRLEPFELRPAPAELPAIDDPTVRAEIEAALPLAAEWGIELHGPLLVPRTGKAHEAVMHARPQGLEVELADAVYRALWVHGRDISRLDTLVEVAGAVGLDDREVHVALGLDTHNRAVELAGQRAEAVGVTGVPTLVHRGRLAVGLLPPEQLREWLAAP